MLKNFKEEDKIGKLVFYIFKMFLRNQRKTLIKIKEKANNLAQRNKPLKLHLRGARCIIFRRLNE